MARRERNDHPGAIHHVMNGGVNGEEIFLDPFDRRRFLNDMAEAFERHHMTILGYALMTTHYHIITQSNTGELSQAMQALGRRYASVFNLKHDRYGPLFRSRFTSRWVDSDDYFQTVVRYVHRNPIDTGVRQLADYTWSSWPAYLGLTEPPGWLDLSRTLQHFGGRAPLIRFVDPDASQTPHAA